jgi:hypothetical protein
MWWYKHRVSLPNPSVSDIDKWCRDTLGPQHTWVRKTFVNKFIRKVDAEYRFKNRDDYVLFLLTHFSNDR